ncbi:MAG: phage portal protein [Aeromicrobium sp.]
MGLFKKRDALTPGSPIQGLSGARLRVATDGRDVLWNDPDGWEQDAPWLWYVGPADGSLGPFGNPLTSEVPGALSNLASVTRCTSIICDTIAGLPWYVRRGQYERLPTPDWLADPQMLRPDMRIVDVSTLWETRLSAVEFWTQLIVAALWLGDGYVYVPVRDESGAPKPPLWQLHPEHVSIEDGRYVVNGEPLPQGSILHLRGMPPYFNGHGKGVLTTHGAELGLASTVRTYASGVFQSGVPAGYLKSSQPNMSADQAAALKATWLQQHGGAKRSIAVLNATTEFHPIALSPVDAQLSSSREWSLRDVAMAFGIPAYMLGVPGDSSTYANVESRMVELVRFTLMPWIRRLEAELESQLARGTTVVVDTNGLLRADTAQRFAAYKSALDSGWLTADEVRALEGLAPMTTEEGAA